VGLTLAQPIRQITLTKFGGLFTESDPRDLPAGAAAQCWDCDFDIAGVTIRPGLKRAIGIFAPPVAAASSWLYLKSSRLPGGLRQTLAQNSDGSLWAENIRGLDVPAIMSQFYTKILNGARAISTTVGEREYICLSDFTEGTDQPRQWDGVNFDRISQVGPGAGPSVPAVTGTTYTVKSISQPYAAHTIDSISWGTSINLYTATPSGTMLVFLGAVGDSHFHDGIYVGDYVYTSGAGNLEGLSPNGTYQVVSVGDYSDVDGDYKYIQVTATLANSDFARGTAGGSIQKTQAVVLMTVPIPPQNAVIGNQIDISGDSVQQWNQVWTIIDTPSEGQLSISSTSLTSNVATYDYSMQSGDAPGWQASHVYNMGAQIVVTASEVWQVTTPGTSGGAMPAFAASPQTDGSVTWTKQTGVTLPATVFNTANGNGIFNVRGATITSATSTTFTIALTSPDIASVAEDGQAISGSGSVLIIDPGTVTVGSGNPGVDPIYGTGTGGQVLPVSGDVTPGQRYALLMFLTRSGYLTPASPPVSFYTTGSSHFFQFVDMAIGPPNVIARVIAITAANAGVGGPYYYIPADVTVPASVGTLGLTQTVTKTVVDDNTSTTSPVFTITDEVLLNSVDVTAAGNNRLQVRELGECVKVEQFQGRCFYIGERVKVDQFYNLTFDGGSVSGKPAGWTISSSLSSYVSLVTSQVFGESLYITNTSGATINPFGTPAAGVRSLYQTAYETPFLSPIILPDTQYSFRVTAMIPANNTGGSIKVGLYSAAAATEWFGEVPFSALNSSALTEHVAQFENLKWDTVPSDLVLRVYPWNMSDGANLVIDRIEVYPSNTPVYQNQVAVSYAYDYESIDGVTGAISTQQYSREPINNITRFVEDELYIDTGIETFSPSPTDSEPAGWNLKEISSLTGSCGPLAEDSGPEYRVKADRNGVWIFDGGNHIKISQEIQKIWDALYDLSLKNIWVKNDIANQRFYVGVPLPTPNKWLPNAPVNATPDTPNVILACSYLLQPNGREIAAAQPVHVSMFTGSLLWRDMDRKWSPWQIASPMGAYINRVDNTQEFWLGGSATGQIYKLDDSAYTDDGAVIDQSYVPYCFADNKDEETLQLGSVRKLYDYASVLIEGAGAFNVTLYPETLATPYYDTQPNFSLTVPALDDTNVPLNETGNRLFIKFHVDGTVGTYFNLRRVVVGCQPDPRIQIRGWNV